MRIESLGGPEAWVTEEPDLCKHKGRVKILGEGGGSETKERQVGTASGDSFSQLSLSGGTVAIMAVGLTLQRRLAASD